MDPLKAARLKIVTKRRHLTQTWAPQQILFDKLFLLNCFVVPSVFRIQTAENRKLYATGTQMDKVSHKKQPAHRMSTKKTFGITYHKRTVHTQTGKDIVL